VQYEFSLDMQDYLPKGLLLQNEEEDIKGELERCESLVHTPLAVDGGDGQHSRVSPRWVVERVKSFYQVVGLSCEGYKDKLLALFEEIEAARDLSMAESKINYPSTPGEKGQRELNRLAWSINYEKKGVQSVKGRHRRRGSSRFL
jgi:hypothetical protein